MGRLVTSVLAGIVASLATLHSALADQRIALVVGNGAYQAVRPLTNPPRDASAISRELSKLGFSTELAIDATLQDMRAAIQRFGAAASAADMAVFFYAGHGIEVSGENWLIPVDARLSTSTDVEGHAINMRSLMRSVGAARSLGLVILDACRDNPFDIRAAVSTVAPDAAPTGRTQTRSVGKGLAPTAPTGNVLVAFAAKDGTVANDGSGENSPFTEALIRHLKTPGLEVTFLFRRVRDDVMAATNGEQQPFVYGSLPRDSIYLNTPSPDQVLAGLPVAALPDSRRANPLFTAADRAAVDMLIQSKKFVAPPFQIDVVGDEAPAEASNLVGVWVSKSGFGGNGRQLMIIATHADAEGVISGYYLYGPPLITSWTQAPAGSAKFKARVRDEILSFSLGPQETVFVRLEAGNTLAVEDRNADGRRTAVRLYPAWTLADRRQGKIASIEPADFAPTGEASFTPERRNPFFSTEDEAAIAKIAAAKQLKLPIYQIETIDEAVAADYRRFVGVWVSKTRSGAQQTGRQKMLIVTHVDSSGVATGFDVSGPPLPNGWNSQVPANFMGFRSQIGSGLLRANKVVSYRLMDNGQILYQAQLSDGRAADNMLYPAWRLTEKTQGRARAVTAPDVIPKAR